MNPFMITTKNPVLVGCGTSYAVPDKMKELGCKKVLIVCDKWLSAQDSFKAFVGAFKDIETVIWDKCIPDPTDTSCEEGAVDARAAGIDGIIGIGGGSPMDTAKGINVLLNSEPPLRAYFAELGPYAKIPNPGVPLVLIPTTSGTGSECSPSAVITNTEIHAKNNLMFLPNITPALAVIDANWTVTMPPHLTAMTGYDAFSHAVETITSNCWNPMSELIALDSVRLIWNNLERAYKDGSDIEARENMHYAAMEVAIAFTDSLINLGHEIAHMIGAKYHIPHGECCAAVTPACLRFISPIMPDVNGRLAQVLGLDPSEEGLGERIYEATLGFRQRLGLKPINAFAEKYGFTKDEIIGLADKLGQPYFLAYQMTADDYRKILTDMWNEE